MNIGELISIKTLEDEERIFGAEERHTPYRAEIRLFSCVQQGDIDLLLAELKNIDSLIIVGKMSEDDIMQYKYMAVSTVTLAIRYAIQGGMNERQAYEFSDRVIRQVDSLGSKDDIIMYVAGEIVELTKAVKRSRIQPSYSPHVKKCICHINENLSKKLTVAELAEVCGISSDYLSQIFKKEMGEALSSYITLKKLEAAKGMLAEGMSSGDICRALGFSSQPHFITSFKKHYHMTPSEYVKLIK